MCANIPRGVALRARRICSETHEYIWQCELHVKFFIERGYAENHVRGIFDEVLAKTLDRQKLLYKIEPELPHNNNTWSIILNYQASTPF